MEHFRAPRSPGASPAEREARVDQARRGLLSYLEARRQRVGLSEKDAKESPEAAQARKTQKQLVDEYLQSRDVTHTM